MSNTERPALALENFENMDTICKEQMLVEAATAGIYAVVETLINLGVAVDANEYNRQLFYDNKNFMTPLMTAASRGHLPILHLLIKSGADVNSKDRFDITATHLAAEHGHYHCLKMLLDAGANCGANTKLSRNNFRTVPYHAGTTPLHLAALNNHVECVKELMQFGADYNAVDERGFTALYIASHSGYDECVLALLRNAVGRDILSLPGFETGDTPLHFAVKRGMVDSVKELLRLGSDVNHLNQSGNSPLHVCVSTSICEPHVSFEILKLLILHGYNTDVNLPDSVELTPLHYVSFNAASVLTRRPEMAKFLIAYGANINITNHQGLSLMQYEYNSNERDISVLTACMETVSVPPRPRDLVQDNNFATASDHLPNNMVTFYTMWLALRRGLDPVPLDDYEHFQQNVRMMGNVVDQNTLTKQRWYQNNTCNPPRLMHQCRYVIRKQMGYKNLRYIKNLPLPRVLKLYLVLGAEINSD